MGRQNESSLNFNGRNISISAVNGQYYVAIKPICEVLNIKYADEVKAIQDNDILSHSLISVTIATARGKSREVICLPERYIYGWLFSIRSDSQELSEFRQECYDTLYDYFHGPMTERLASLKAKSDAELEVERLERELVQSPVYWQLQSAKDKLNAARTQLIKLDQELYEDQLNIFTSSESKHMAKETLREKLIRTQKIHFRNDT